MIFRRLAKQMQKNGYSSMPPAQSKISQHVLTEDSEVGMPRKPTCPNIPNIPGNVHSQELIIFLFYLVSPQNFRPQSFVLYS